MIWPSYSPDLSSPNYFQWLCLKNHIYITATVTIDDLRARIISEIATVTPEMLKHIFINLIKCAHPHKAVNG